MTGILPLACLAPAKVNLGLLVGAVREDGKHELLSVMQSISLADQVTLEAAPPGSSADEVVCPGVQGENLALRALRLLRVALDWRSPPLRLSIRKRVPVAAGLGGGSADAAAALRLGALAAGLDDEALLAQLASRLGADVPSQVRPGRWLAMGAGERLRALPDPEPRFGLLVVPVPVALSTPEVYACADRLLPRRRSGELQSARAQLEQLLGDGAPLPPQELFTNDLEGAAIALCPLIVPLLEQVRALGADHAFVSGSGPTVIGVFAGIDGPGRARAAAAACRPEGSSATWAVPVGARFAAAVPLGAQQSARIDR